MTTSSTTPYNYSALTATKPTASTVAAAAAAAPKSLGQADFLNLMSAQMTHQDPSQPMQNGEFITQMAQFGTVSGIQGLQSSFSSFANSINSGQALQATSLVGKQVVAPGTQGVLAAGGSITGDVNLSVSAPDVTLQITDSTGAVVNNVDLGAQAAGAVPFTWNGQNSSGNPAAPGIYNIQATANIGGTNTVLPTDISSKVSSVSIGAGGSGVTVNLAGGLPSVGVSQIKQIL